MISTPKNNAGRPRKPGERYPCGKRTPAQVAADQRREQEEIVRPAVEARMKIFKVPRKVAKSNAMGSPLHRLEYWGLIKPSQADAGHSFAEVLREYKELPKAQHKAGFIPAVGGNESDETPGMAALNRRIESRAKAYMEALAEVDQCSGAFLRNCGANDKPWRSVRSCTAIVWDVCVRLQDIHGDIEIGALRVGLNAIARVINGRKAA